MYYAAACQTDFPAPRHRDEIAERTRRMAEIIEQTVVGYRPFFDVKLFAFPEFAHAVPVFETVEDLQRELAVELPNAHTEVYCRLARQLDIHIQTGTFLERDPRYPGHVFNTTLLIGSNLGNANAHTTNNLPILLAGGPYKHGSHLAFDAKNNEPLANLFVTMLRAMGLEADSFASSTGSLNGLEVAG